MSLDFGFSFEWQQPVSGLIWERLGLSFILEISTLIFACPRVLVKSDPEMRAPLCR